ncbi:MAG: hypothetical protein IT445_03440 [Phycisphaeraceae bacterium]|nr:hypothetical protein [Phycisphaeraceae bacterium]
MSAGPAAAQWVVRPVDGTLFPYPTVFSTVNVMIDATGKVIVGSSLDYSTELTASSLVSISPGQLLFDRQHLGMTMGFGSFALDPDGSVLMSGKENWSDTSVYIGQDTGAGGGIQYGQLSIDPSVAVRDSTMVVNSHGIPTVVWSSTATDGYYSQTFNPATGQWGTTVTEIPEPSSGPTTVGPSAQFDKHDRLLVGGIVDASNGWGIVRLMQRDPVTGSQQLLFQDPYNASRSRGTALAVGPDNQIAFAYVDRNFNPVIQLIDDEQIATHILTDIPSALALMPESVAFDANGLPALVITPRDNPIVLARMNSNGQWTVEQLPITGLTSSITFDNENNPYVAVKGQDGVIRLLSPNIAPLLCGDFNLTSFADQNDLSAMDQAIHDTAGYMAANPNLINAELLLIGDYNDDAAIDIFDAYTMADNLPVEHLGSLVTRSAGYFALDQAHAGGNFFSTTLVTGKTYAEGDARGDLNPLPDQLIDAADIDYLFDQWYLASPDLRCDLNNDGIVGALDAAILVKMILGTHFGDANLDGIVNLSDLQILGDHWQSTTANWSMADFTGDGKVNLADLQVLGDNWGATAGDFQALAALYIPEPAALGLLLTASTLMLSARRARG